MSFVNVFRLKFISFAMKKLQKIAEKLPVQQEDVPTVSFHADKDGIFYLDDYKKVSEDLNDMSWDFDMFLDTTKLTPGVVIYIISQQKPTAQRPWVVYKYEPRVITSIHDSGVNGGTVFFTYSHEFVQPLSLSGSQDKNEFQVVSSEDTIYSPLTKEHAQFICAELNSQSRSLYQSHLAKMKQK